MHKNGTYRPMQCQWLTRRESDKINKNTGEANVPAKTHDNNNFEGESHNDSPSSLQYLNLKEPQFPLFAEKLSFSDAITQRQSVHGCDLKLILNFCI